MVDGVYRRLKPARMQGIDVYFGEILSEHAEHSLATHHLGHLLCGTPNDFYNALVCNALGSKFGRHRTLQLATAEDARSESRKLTSDQRGHLAFGDECDFDWLQQRIDDGWRVQTTRLGEEHDLEDFSDRLGEPGKDWLLLACVRPNGAPRLYSTELPFEPEPGWRVLYFAPAQDGSADATESGSDSGSNDTSSSSETSTS